MSEFSEVLSELSFRVRALERRELELQIRDVVRRIELLESASGSARSKHTTTSGLE
jgi:hypothetical protein